MIYFKNNEVGGGQFINLKLNHSNLQSVTELGVVLKLKILSYLSCMTYLNQHV